MSRTCCPVAFSMWMVTRMPMRMPMGVLMLSTIMYTMILTFLTPLEIMSVPTQNTIGTAWMETAISSFHTPVSVSSSPMAIPCKQPIRGEECGHVTRCGAVVGHLEQAVHGERDHHEEAAEGGQQPLLGARLGLGGRGGGVRVRAGEAARRHAENQPMTGQY